MKEILAAVKEMSTASKSLKKTVDFRFRLSTAKALSQIGRGAIVVSAAVGRWQIENMNRILDQIDKKTRDCH